MYPVLIPSGEEYPILAMSGGGEQRRGAEEGVGYPCPDSVPGRDTPVLIPNWGTPLRIRPD